MTFADLRRKIGRLVGQSIGPGQFGQVIKERDKSGAFQMREMEMAIIYILEYLESIEKDENIQPAE
jgi:hypothetical protein